MRLSWFVAGLLPLASCAVSQDWRSDDRLDGTSITSTGEGGDLFTGSGGTGGGALECDGSCVGIGPDGFEESPSLMWIGAPADVPPCPDFAPLLGFEGFANLHVAPHTCPACSCSPASCALPEAMHASAAKCANAASASSIAWGAPPAWEGVCTAEGAIPAGLVCAGVACVQSLTIEAPIVEPCQPTAGNAIPLPEPSWGELARECRITASDLCPLEGYVCAPTPPEGFALCVHFKGDDPLFECPDDYPDRHVVYAGNIDARECAPCGCGEPEGVACAALVSAHGDGVCGPVVASVMVASGQGACVDLLNGTALGSKSAAWVVDEPGSCAPSGGEPSGQVEPGGAMTYCCQPGLVPAK